MTSVKMIILASVLCLGWIGAAQAVNCGPACQRYYCWQQGDNSIRDTNGVGILMTLEDENGTNGRYCSDVGPVGTPVQVFVPPVANVCPPTPGWWNAKLSNCTGAVVVNIGNKFGCASCLVMN